MWTGLVATPKPNPSPPDFDTTACTAPADASSAYTDPIDCSLQCAPPSCVAHSFPLAATQPSSGSANRISGRISAFVASGAGAGGAGTSVQVRPPSPVRHTWTQGDDPHVPPPSTQPVVRDTNVTDATSKPAGRPPLGPVVEAPATVEPGSAGALDDVEAVEGAVDALSAGPPSDWQEPRRRQPTTIATSPLRRKTVTAQLWPLPRWLSGPASAPYEVCRPE